MKKSGLLTVVFLWMTINLLAQNVGINDDASLPYAGAMLHVQSTNKGLLMPRMTTAQRLAMTNLTPGLMVYDTNLNEFMYYASRWRNLGGNAWQLGGNAGINASHFLGTTNSAALQFRTQNINRLTIDTQGNLVIASENQSIRFPATGVSNVPMIQMFASGTQNSDRMIIAHSPGFPKWGIEYKDTTDVIYFRDSNKRHFAFNISSGFMGLGVEIPAFPLDAVGRFRLRGSGFLGNSPGIWFSNQINTFDRAFLGMSKPDSGFGIYSQHLGKWAIEMELMREPRLGINTRATTDGVVRAELHVVHTNFGGANDGIRLNNEGSNNHFWNLYTSNTTGAFEFYKQGIKRATIDAGSGAYTAVSDEKMKLNMTELSSESIMPRILQLKPSRYQMKPIRGTEGNMIQSDHYHFGFSAQEVELLFPELVFKGSDAPIHEVYTMNYSGFGVLAIKAVQVQQNEIQQLKQEIAELKELIRKQLLDR